MTADFGTEQELGTVAEAGNDDDDERAEQLASEIDETRIELTETVEAIGQKLEPSNLAREATETARQATIGKVEQMSMGAQETWRDVRSGNAEGILQTIKSNPLPSAMIGLGLGMLFMNRGAATQTSWSGANSGYGGTGYRGGTGSRIGSTIGDVRDQAGETIGRVSDQAGETMDRVASSMGQTASELPQQVGELVDQQGMQVRRMIDENPLAAGAVALAAGAAIGMLIPTTRMEREAVGPQRDRLVGQAEATINDSLDSMERDSGPTSGGGSSSGADS